MEAESTKIWKISCSLTLIQIKIVDLFLFSHNENFKFEHVKENFNLFLNLRAGFNLHKAGERNLFKTSAMECSLFLLPAQKLPCFYHRQP